MILQCISEESLVRKFYTGNRINNTILWTKVACRGNWSTNSIGDNTVSGFYFCLYILIFVRLNLFIPHSVPASLECSIKCPHSLQE